MSSTSATTEEIFQASAAGWTAFSILLFLFGVLSYKLFYGRYNLFHGVRLKSSSRGQPLGISTIQEKGEYAMMIANFFQILAFAISIALPWNVTPEILVVIQLLGINLSREQSTIRVSLPWDQEVLNFLQSTSSDVQFLAHSYRDPIILAAGIIGIPIVCFLLFYLVLCVIAVVHGPCNHPLVDPTEEEEEYFDQLPITQQPIFLFFLMIHTDAEEDDEGDSQDGSLDKQSQSDGDEEAQSRSKKKKKSLQSNHVPPSPLRSVNGSNHFTLSSSVRSKRSKRNGSTIFGEESILTAKQIDSRAVAAYEHSPLFWLVHQLVDPLFAMHSLKFVVEMRVRRLRGKKERIESSQAVSSLAVIQFYFNWLFRISMLVATILSMTIVLWITCLAGVTGLFIIVYLLAAKPINNFFSEHFLSVRVGLERLLMLPLVTFAGSLLSCTYPLDPSQPITLDRFPNVVCWSGFHWLMGVSALVAINYMVFQILGNNLLKAEVLVNEPYKNSPSYDTFNVFIQILIALIPVYFSQSKYLVIVHTSYVVIWAFDILLIIFYQPAREDHYNHIRLGVSCALEWSFGVALYCAMENSSTSQFPFWLWLIGLPGAFLVGYLINWLIFYIRFNVNDPEYPRRTAKVAPQSSRNNKSASPISNNDDDDDDTVEDISEIE